MVWSTYKIMERKGLVAYKLELPETMSAIFPVFHVSHLKKCLRVLEERIEPRGIKLKSDLVYVSNQFEFWTLKRGLLETVW
jgi:hypothetical protein